MKKRKLHQLKGIIKGVWPGQTSSKSPYPQQPFYSLDVITENLFGPPTPETVYVFPNLVSPSLWKVLDQKTFKDKTYHFFCERRTRGWRLRELEEINIYESSTN